MTVGAAAIAVVTAIAVPTWLGGDDAPQGSSPPPAAMADDVPERAATCPLSPNLDRIREADTFPDGSVLTARLCDVTRARPAHGSYPTLRPPHDVLTGDDLRAFLADVKALPSADPTRCNGLNYQPSDGTVQLGMTDGSTTIVRLDLCTDTMVDDSAVESFAIWRSFLEVADSRRDEASAPAEPIGLEPDCDWPEGTLTHLQPDREKLTAAAFCANDGDQPRPLDRARVRMLQAVWSRALPGGTPRQDDCPRVLRRGTIVAVDDWDDTIVMRSDGCATLVVEGPSGPADGWLVEPTAEEAAELGIGPLS